MKAKELRDRTDQDLSELKGQIERDLFGSKMKNFTGQLDDTSLLGKARRDLARIAQIQGQRLEDQGRKDQAQKASGESGSKQ
jgi:large subunit ribosomal protein L29